MDLAKLRLTLRAPVIALSQMNRHVDLPDVCEKLGLPFLDQGVSKRDKVTEAFDALQDTDLPNTARRFLEYFPPSARLRNDVQDILWTDVSSPEINKRFRREVAQAIDIELLYLDSDKFDDLLERLWVLDNDPMAAIAALLGERDTRSLRVRIKRHVHENRGDWETATFFENIGALDCSNRRFTLFMERLASSDVRPKEASQREFVDLVNRALNGSGVEFRETDSRDGYPQFSLVSAHGAATGRPKNLIFASHVKPDLRFRDAIHNDVEIVTNADKVLIYDRPIGIEGLDWDTLQAWWAESNGMTNDRTAKVTLYRRLLASLPEDSPPQRLLFESYFEHFKSAIPDLPALLPEVWLHWDPKTVQQRGRDALSRFRMDFLLLLQGGVRVVLEVDGKQHYSDDAGKASPSKYAEMVPADRDLKMAGYHVFRFGGHELQKGSSVPSAFFDSLFKRFRVSNH